MRQTWRRRRKGRQNKDKRLNSFQGCSLRWSPMGFQATRSLLFRRQRAGQTPEVRQIHESSLHGVKLVTMSQAGYYSGFSSFTTRKIKTAVVCYSLELGTPLVPCWSRPDTPRPSQEKKRQKRTSGLAKTQTYTTAAAQSGRYFPSQSPTIKHNTKRGWRDVHPVSVSQAGSASCHAASPPSPPSVPSVSRHQSS